jgi:hypothetical protein
MGGCDWWMSHHVLYSDEMLRSMKELILDLI